MQSAPNRWSRRAFLGSLGVMPITRTCMPISPALAGSRRTPITVWTWQTNTEAEALKAVAEAFNQAQQEVDVHVVQRPAVYSSLQLITALRGGVGPDICVFGRAVLAERAAEGLLEELDPFLANSEIDLDHDFYTCAASDVRVDQHVVGVPIDTEVRVLLFNQSVLTEEKVIGPEWDPTTGVVTFDHLGDVSRQLDRKSQSGAYERAGFVPFLGEGSPYVYLHAWHARYFTETECEFALDGREVEDAATWVHDFLQRADSSALARLVDFPQFQPGGLGSAFSKGKVVFMLVRDWELARIERLGPAFQVGATLVPSPDATRGSASWATGTAASIMNGAPYPEEAFRFLEYLVSVEAQSDFSLRMGRLPSRNDLPADVMRGLARPSFVTDLVVPTAVPSCHVPIASQFHDLLMMAWTDISFGRTSVSEGLGALERKADDALASSGLCE